MVRANGRTDAGAKLSIGKQPRTPGIGRSAAHHQPRPVSDVDLKPMKLHLDHPFAGRRMLQGILVREGCQPGSIRSGPWTSPTLPWRVAFGMAAVVDWFSRLVRSWRIPISPDADSCIKALEEALARYGPPEILNTDQGSQFTSTGFIEVLARRKIQIGMDGKGAGRGNSSSSGSGAARNTKQSVCEPMEMARKPGRASPDIRVACSLGPVAFTGSIYNTRRARTRRRE